MLVRRADRRRKSLYLRALSTDGNSVTDAGTIRVFDHKRVVTAGNEINENLVALQRTLSSGSVITAQLDT